MVGSMVDTPGSGSCGIIDIDESKICRRIGNVVMDDIPELDTCGMLGSEDMVVIHGSGACGMLDEDTGEKTICDCNSCRIFTSFDVGCLFMLSSSNAFISSSVYSDNVYIVLSLKSNTVYSSPPFDAIYVDVV